MANGSGLATDNFRPGMYRHSTSGVEYTVALDHGVPRMSYKLPGRPGPMNTEKLEYFLGSGHLGLTYLYSRNNYWFESPVAYYSSLDGYSMKPGLAGSAEMPPALTINGACLRCHMSDVQPQDPGTENRYQSLPFLHVGITCESCHGDSRAHVASAGRASIVNPAKLAPEKRDSTCIVCHLEGDTSVERRGRSAAAFRPGEDIRDDVSYFVFAGANTTKRAVSEIEQFGSSRCKAVTGPSMSCMTCHNPHVSISPADRVRYYRGKCLGCHTQDKFVQDHYIAQPDCTSCHMPKTGAENIAHVAWTDHRIRQRPDHLENSAGPDQSRDLIPVLDTGNRPRDLALAYYNLVVKGMASERPRATTLVATALRSDPEDEALLRAAGVLDEMNGSLDAARREYAALLKKDPTNLAANTNLGTLLAKSGDLEAAARIWSEAFLRNEDLPSLGTNLALAECRLGDPKAANDVLSRLFLYNPDLRSVRKRFAEGKLSPEQCPPPSRGATE